MTTTADALTNGEGAALQLVVAIEGYEYLITDRDAQLAQDAWAGTGFENNVPLEGLFVDWSRMHQSIAPWDTRIAPMSIALSVMDCDGVDRFGVDTHATAAGVETKLDADVNTTDTTITVLSTSLFGATGTIYIGQERIEYTGKSATTFTGCTRGTLAPFKAGSETDLRYGRNHAIPHYDNVAEAKVPPSVSSTPRNWIGKWIGVWLHVRSGGVLNVKDDAQCLFAGTITSIGDSSNGMTVVECTEARSRVQDAVLFNDQLVGRVAEGITLRTGMVFTASDGLATTLSVIVGAATDYEVEPGLYTLSEFESVINAWLQAAKTAAALNFTWSYRAAVTTQGGVRGQFLFEHTTAGLPKIALFDCTAPYPLTFMGWHNAGPILASNSNLAAWSTTSPEEPFRLLNENGPTNYSTALELTDSSGTWIDNTGALPSAMKPFPTSATSQWGILKFSTGAYVLAHYTSATSFTIYTTDGLVNFGGESSTDLVVKGLRVTEPGDIGVSQVVMLEGTMADVLTKILASTGVSTYNGSSDALAAQLGLGIPWALLDTAWTDSIAAISASTGAQAVLVVLDKPRKFWDVVKTDLLLRRASLIWKDEALRLTTWSTPTATTATWDLTEDNKSSPANTVDAQRSPSQTTDEYQYNTLKIAYNVDLAGTYRDSLTIVDRAAVSDGERAITIQCPNSFAGIVATGQGVEDLAAQAAGWLPMFARPVRKVRRSIGLEHICTMAPGDQANVTDNFARDPSTGIRGLTAVPALIVAVSWDIGGPDPGGGGARDIVMEIDLVLEPGRRYAPYSPCAEVDQTAPTGGYVAGTKTLTLQAHAHSETSQAHDATNFENGDKVNVIQIDPANGAAPLAWPDTIASSPTTDTRVLTTGLAGWDATKRYRMVSAAYATAVSTQKSDVYQADSTTGIIAGLAQAYVYGLIGNAATWTATTVANPVSLYSNYAYGDGLPLDTGYERDIAELVNNLANYRTAPILPNLNAVAISAPSGTYQRSILYCMPFAIGPGTMTGRKRLIHVAPFVRNTIASTKSVWVTISRYPPTGSSLTWTTAALPEYVIPQPSNTATFSVGASAGWTTLTAQTLDCRACDLQTGKGYLIIEAEKGIDTRGFGLLYLGPLESQ